MGFFRKDKNEQWSLFKKKRTKTNLVVNENITNDNDDILTMPDNILQEELITKPQQDIVEAVPATSESILPFTAPVEDLNLAEAEMLNKMEAEQAKEDTKDEDNNAFETLDDTLQEELVNDSEELMDMLESESSQSAEKTDNEQELCNMQYQDAETTKSRQKQAMEQILSKGNTSTNETLTPDQMQQIFCTPEPEVTQENLTPTQKVNNIFGNSEKTNTQQNKPTPSEWVHSVFGKEQKSNKQNEVPTRDSMRQIFSNQKSKSNNAVPSKSELFKTITNKDE